jgi:hypothetical protein
MRKIILSILLTFTTVILASAQNPQGQIVRAKIENGDTLIISILPEHCVNAKMPRKYKVFTRKHSKLIDNVKRAYPYAKIAGMKLREYEDVLKSANSDKERRQLMKQAEQELKDEFEDDLKKLTFKQGIILIKLVDRETGDSSYELVQELRGKFTAFFWQTFARLFGYNLKVKYDPNGKDKEIEDIVVMIEKGLI